MIGKDKASPSAQPPHDGVISIIGSGMKIVGNCDTEGTLRIEGELEGTVRAGKAVVIGKDGVVLGDVITQDAIIGGRVSGTVIAESRLELQATCIIDGEIHARRIKLDEGGRVNGAISTGEVTRPKATQPGRAATAGSPTGGSLLSGAPASSGGTGGTGGTGSSGGGDAEAGTALTTRPGEMTSGATSTGGGGLGDSFRR